MKPAFLERARVLAPLTHALVVDVGMCLQLRLHDLAKRSKVLGPRRELKLVPNLRRSASSERAQTHARACMQRTCTPRMHARARTHIRTHTRARAHAHTHAQAHTRRSSEAL
jgi:hypothetical protein